MQRRDFLHASVGAPWLAATGLESAAAGKSEGGGSGRQFFELRRYRLASAEDRSLADGYLRDAAIPAYNRLGIRPVGVFEPAESGEEQGRTLTVLLPYDSLEQLVTARDKLAQDAEYRNAAESYLSTPKSDPAYERIESNLMIAFGGYPQLVVPAQTKSGRSRLFELRTYESHNEHKARLKVEMFDKAEIELFSNLGFSAVFYGDKLVGDKLPNLTYMLAFDDREQREELWQKFFESDGWQRLKSMERYKNTVSKVHNWFLQPTGYSQL